METEKTLTFPPPFKRLAAPPRWEPARGTKRVSTPSLEQLTEARLAELGNQSYLWQTPPPRSHQIVLASENTGQQIVLASPEPQQTLPLRWRGQPVSEELQLYASRVARGEDLAPYRGPILANASLEPWVAADIRAPRKSPRRGPRVLLLLAVLGALAAFVQPSAETGLPELQQRVPLVSEPQQLAAATPAVPTPPQSEPAPQDEPARAQEQLEPSGARVGLGAVTAPSRAPGLPLGGPPSASSAPPKQAEAQSRAVPGAEDPALGAPGSDSAGPSMLLVDEPSF